MPDSNISLETDAAAITAAQWREYADHVETYGTTQPVAVDQLRHALGDIYGGYIAAKNAEYAEKLERTRASFAAQDDEAAVSLRNVTG